VIIRGEVKHSQKQQDKRATINTSIHPHRRLINHINSASDIMSRLRPAVPIDLQMVPIADHQHLRQLQGPVLAETVRRDKVHSPVAGNRRYSAVAERPDKVDVEHSHGPPAPEAHQQSAQMEHWGGHYIPAVDTGSTTAVALRHLGVAGGRSMAVVATRAVHAEDAKDATDAAHVAGAESHEIDEKRVLRVLVAMAQHLVLSALTYRFLPLLNLVFLTSKMLDDVLQQNLLLLS
jgi:hypothetical protein